MPAISIIVIGIHGVLDPPVPGTSKAISRRFGR